MQLFFSIEEFRFCENFQVIWCRLQVCKENPKGEVEGTWEEVLWALLEGKRIFMIIQHFWAKYSLALLCCCYPYQTFLLQKVRLAMYWEETEVII